MIGLQAITPIASIGHYGGREWWFTTGMGRGQHPPLPPFHENCISVNYRYCRVGVRYTA